MFSVKIYTIYFYIRLSGQKSSVVYAVNGVLMTSVFFLCRVANVWYMYNVYAKELGKWKIRKSLKAIMIYGAWCVKFSYMKHSCQPKKRDRFFMTIPTTPPTNVG